MNDGFARPNTTKHRQATAAMVAAMLACAAPARAADCTITTTGVAFGVYDPTLASPTDSVGDVTVRCSYVSGGATRINYTVALSAGGSGDPALRQLRAGPAVLNYNLFDDATRTRVWGNGTGGSALVSGALVVNPGAFSTRTVSHPIYGRIPPLQAVDAGQYSDTVLVTLTF